MGRVSLEVTAGWSCGEGVTEGNSWAELWGGCHWREQLGRVVGRASLEGIAGRRCREGITGGNSWVTGCREEEQPQVASSVAGHRCLRLASAKRENNCVHCVVRPQ